MSRWFPLLVLSLLVAVNIQTSAEDSPAAKRREHAREFHLRAQERTGILVPLYLYPANIHENPAYNRLMDLKRRYETVPVWVIVNPASGPGKHVDPNYTKAIDRLRGSGCVVLGYVTTSYGKRTEMQVRKEIDQWLTLYPRTQGIFFDEMRNEDTEEAAAHQAALTRSAHEAGCWPIVANPGTDTPGRYFAANAADVFIVHEGDDWPTEAQLKGDYFGGYADYPPFTRGVLLHSRPEFDRASLRMVRKYVRWVYVTEDRFKPGDPQATNPWDSVSAHLEELFEQLSE